MNGFSYSGLTRLKNVHFYDTANIGIFTKERKHWTTVTTLLAHSSNLMYWKNKQGIRPLGIAIKAPAGKEWW